MKKIISAISILVTSFIVIQACSGFAAENGFWIISIDASSVLEPSKGAYDQGNIMDMSDDSWCEGKKDAGAGESITIKLAAPMAVKKLFVKNGMGLSQYWAANNRVREVRINGITSTLKDDPAFQSVNLPGKATDTLTLSIVSVYKGEKWNDTCLAEVSFADPGGEFNQHGNYSKIAGKNWISAEGMASFEGLLVFSKGFLFSIDSVPCGDETCPIRTRGSCRPRGRNAYECRSIEHCRGTYDPVSKKAGRVCTPEHDAFTLDVSGGSPVIIVKGKKTRLAPFD